MTHILILVSADLLPPHLAAAERFIEEYGLGLNGKPQWISPRQAAEISIQNALTMAQMKTLRRTFENERIDVLCVPQKGRKKKLLLADMDSTIVTSETLDELAARAGIGEKVAEITKRAMNGELDFHASLKERVNLLKGLPVLVLQETLDDTVLCEGAKEMVKGLKEFGTTCVLVSGGFTFFTSAIAAQCGFHHHHGNILNHDGKTLDGTVEPPILDKDSKLSFLKSYAQDLGIDLADTVAIGDGANDLPMLNAAGLGIGYRPRPIVEESMLNILKFADLRAVLWAMSISTD